MDKGNSTPRYKSEKKGGQSRHSRKSKSKGRSEVKDHKQTVVFMVVSDDEGAVSIPYQLWADPIKKLVKDRGGYWCPVFKVWKTSKVQL